MFYIILSWLGMLEPEKWLESEKWLEPEKWLELEECCLAG